MFLQVNKPRRRGNNTQAATYVQKRTRQTHAIEEDIGNASVSWINVARSIILVTGVIDMWDQVCVKLICREARGSCIKYGEREGRGGLS